MSAPGSRSQMINPADMPALLKQMEEIMRTLTAAGYGPFTVKNQNPGATAGPHGDALTETFFNKMVTISLMLSELEGSQTAQLNVPGETIKALGDAVKRLSYARVVDGFPRPRVEGVEMPRTLGISQPFLRLPLAVDLHRLIGFRKASPFAALVYPMIWGACCESNSYSREGEAYEYAGIRQDAFVATDAFTMAVQTIKAALPGVSDQSIANALDLGCEVVYRKIMAELSGYEPSGLGSGYATKVNAAVADAGGLGAAAIGALARQVGLAGAGHARIDAWAATLGALKAEADRDRGRGLDAAELVQTQAMALYKPFESAGGAPVVEDDHGWAGGAPITGMELDPATVIAPTGLSAAYLASYNAFINSMAEIHENVRAQYYMWGLAVMHTCALDDWANDGEFAGKLEDRLTTYLRVHELWKKFFQAHEEPMSITYMAYFGNFESAVYRYLNNRLTPGGNERRPADKRRTPLTGMEEIVKVIQGSQTLSDYFVLLKKDGRGGFIQVDIKTDISANPGAYSLNLKKTYDTEMITGGGVMVGGAPNDILWLSDIPLWTGAIMYNGQPLRISGPDQQTGTWLRDLLRQVYQYGPRQSNLQFKGVTVNLPAVVAQSRRQHVYINQNWDSLKKSLQTIDREKAAAEAIAFKERDLHISEALWEARSMWEVRGDEVVKLDDKGNEVDVAPMDSCGFIKDVDAQRCMNMLNDCSANGDCGSLLDMEFDVAMDMTTMTEEVLKMSPAHALRVLNHYRFGKIDAKDDKRVPGLIVYKAQSVDSWIQDLLSNQDRCTQQIVPAAPDVPTPPGCGTLAQQLGREKAAKILDLLRTPRGHGFISYLRILVGWLNANPRILNPELVVYKNTKPKQPPADPRLVLYEHQQAYGFGQPNRSSYTCAAMELAGNIRENTYSFGSDAAAMIQDITYTPNIDMPFSRGAFLGAVPNVRQTPYGLVFGGGLDNVQHGGGFTAWRPSFTGIPNMTNSRAFGTEAYRRMIDNLQHRLVEKNRGSGLTPKSRTAIQTKLDAMRHSNDELLKASKSLSESMYYFNKFHRQVDTFTNLEDIKKKQYLLMEKSRDHNKNMSQVSQIIIQLAKALEGRGSYGERLDPNTYRPLSDRVHDVHFEKRF